MHAGAASGAKGPADPPPSRLLAPGDAKARRRKAPLCEPPHRQRPMSMAGLHASAIDPARWTHANAPDPLLPGALRGAQFHASGQTLRRLPALADQRHHRIGARAGRRPFSTQAAHRPHRARPCRTALSRPDRPKRGACARGRAGAGRCAAGEFRARGARRAQWEPGMPFELIMAALISVYLVILALGHVLVIAAIYKCLREDYIGGRGRRTTADPTIDTGGKRATGAINLSESLEPQHMHALGARWLLGSARRRESRDPELRAASGFPE